MQSAHIAVDQFSRLYGEAGYLVGHSVSGEMPLGMRLTLLRHASELASKAHSLAQGEAQIAVCKALESSITIAYEGLQ